MNFVIELMGIIAAIFTTLAFLPQTIRVIKTKSTQDLSWYWIVIFAFGVFLWLIYGILIMSIGVILGNFITLVCLIIIIRYKFIYN